MNYLIIGGSKSGKSEASEKIALTLSGETKSMIWCESLTQRRSVRQVSLDKVIYIATMKPYDKEDEERIKKHIQNRVGLNFTTLEVQRNLHEIVNNIKSDDTVLLDSITSLLTNEMFIGNEIIKNPSINILNGLKQIIKKAKNTVVVSDYIFNDAIEYDEITEKFKRELAIINKELAKSCDNVIECSFGNVKYHLR
ncbi:MAG TPA: bifunctional adenosylcobinamide kinase/adenosylcobinamide-phosphate guanylyltransferase [Clostridium sp.]